jgi:hypothetical protein
MISTLTVSHLNLLPLAGVAAVGRVVLVGFLLYRQCLLDGAGKTE